MLHPQELSEIEGQGVPDKVRRNGAMVELFISPSCSCERKWEKRAHCSVLCSCLCSVWMFCAAELLQSFGGESRVLNCALSHCTLTRYSIPMLKQGEWATLQSWSLCVSCIAAIQQPLTDLGIAQLQLNLDLSVVWTKARCLPSPHSKDPNRPLLSVTLE